MSYQPNCWHCTHPTAWRACVVLLGMLIGVAAIGPWRVTEALAWLALTSAVLWSNLGPALMAAFPLVTLTERAR